jgi:hypothetical protein
MSSRVARVYVLDARLAVKWALGIVGFDALYELVTALLFRHPYYENFLIAALAMSLAMIVVTVVRGVAAGMAAGIAVVLVHFGLAWLGLRVTGGQADHLLAGTVFGCLAAVVVSIPWGVYLWLRPVK